MYSRTMSWLRYGSGSLVLALAAAACGTKEVQLEAMHVALSLQDPELMSSSVGATCLTFVNDVDPDVSYEVRMNGRPLQVDLQSDETLQVNGGSLMFCAGAGDYNVSLVLKSKTVAQTGTRSMRGGSQHVFILSGDRHAPDVRAAEVDMSTASASFDLRRIRITNLASDKQPVQLLYFDEDDQEVGQSQQIAYGDTWTGTVPASVKWWRLTPTQIWKYPIYTGPGSSRIWDSYCRELPPTGLIIDASQPDEDATMTTYPFHDEPYWQRPTTCTPDPTKCTPPAHCPEGW